MLPLLFLTIVLLMCSSFSTCSVDVDVIVNQITFEEPLITESRKPYLRRLIYSESIYFYVKLYTPLC